MMKPTYQPPNLQNSFDVLVQEHYEIVLRYAFSLLDGEIAEDLVHDTFIAAFDRLASGRGDEVENWGNWLRGTLRHHISAHWRRKYRLPEETVDCITEIAAEVDDDNAQEIRAELLGNLHQCMAKLDGDQKTLIWRHYKGKTRLDHLAEEMAVAPGTLRVRLHRIRQWLKECLKMFATEAGAN